MEEKDLWNHGNPILEGANRSE